MLDVLLAAERDGLIDPEGIREEVDTFMFEVNLTLSYSNKNYFFVGEF